jgi:hypothetical protein
VNTENEFYQYFVEDYVNEESNINGERENGNVINIMSDDANNKKCINIICFICLLYIYIYLYSIFL